MTTRTHPDSTGPLSVALVTLGCARNEVDSEELAGRLEADGFRLVDDPADADTVVVNTCGFVEAAKKDSVDTLLQAARPQGLRSHAGRRRRRLPGRALRQGPRGRRCPRPTRCSASTTTPTSPPGCARSWPARRTTRTRRRTAAGCCRSRRSTDAANTLAVPGHGRLEQPERDRRRCVRPPARAPYAAGSTAARWPRSSWPAAATGAARSARSRASAARSSAAARPTCSPRRGGWPPRACASCSWSARTPRRTARTSATSGCSRRCCPSWPRSTASSGSGCPTSSPPRPGPGWSRRSPTTPGCRAVLRPVVPARQRDGAAPDAPLRRPGELPRTCSTGSATWRPRPGSAPT